MDQKFECVAAVNEALPLALGRVYVQHAFPAGYKVSHVLDLLIYFQKTLIQTNFTNIGLHNYRSIAYDLMQSTQMSNAYVTGGRR